MPDSPAKTISHNKGNLCPSDQKTLAFVLPQPVFYNNRDGYSTNFTNLIDFFISLSDKFKQVVLLLPVVEGKKGRYPLNLPANIKILAIPYISPGNTLWRLNLLFRGLPQVVRAVVKDFANCDIVGFTALTGIGTFAFLLTRLIHNKPGFFLVRGDRLRTATFSTSHRLKRQLKCLRIKLYDRILCTQIRRQFPVFTQGHKLTEKYIKYGECVYPLNALISEDILSDKKDIISRSNHLSDEIRLLYVGRLSGEKNVGAIIKTLGKLKDVHLNIKLDVAGTGPQADELASLAEKLALSPIVRFLGFVPHGRQIRDLYRNSDIFILASLTEGLPRSMIEAMANGSVICVSSAGGIPAVIQNGINGFIFNIQNDVEMLSSLKDAINVCQNPEAKKKMLLKALDTARDCTFKTRGEYLAEILCPTDTK